MKQRGGWGSVADRVRQGAAEALPPAPALPADVEHCCPRENGRLPGLLLSWRRVADHYEGRVVRLVWEDEGWSLVDEWLPVTMLERA